jgi:hypothetical protein
VSHRRRRRSLQVAGCPAWSTSTSTQSQATWPYNRLSVQMHVTSASSAGEKGPELFMPSSAGRIMVHLKIALSCLAGQR